MNVSLDKVKLSKEQDTGIEEEIHKQLEAAGFNVEISGPNQEFLLELDALILRAPETAPLYADLLCLVARTNNVDALERLRSFATFYRKYEVGRKLITMAHNYVTSINALRSYINTQNSDNLQERYNVIEADLIKALYVCISEVIHVDNLEKVVQGDESVLDIFNKKTASMQLLLKAFRKGVLQDMNLEDQEQFLGITIKLVDYTELSENERTNIEQLHTHQLSTDTAKNILQLNTFTKGINNPLSKIGIITLDQKIVGALILSSHNPDIPELYGSSLVIDPAFIGKGCMLPYIQKLLEDAGRNYTIVGDVFDDNEVALNFYTKLGFVKDINLPTDPEYPANGIRLRRPASVTGITQ